MSKTRSSDKKDQYAPPAFGIPDEILSTPIHICEILARQDGAIQAIEEAAHVLRQGKRVLRDPKLLALAVQLRSQQAADLRNSATYLADMKRFNRFMFDMVRAFQTHVRNPEDRERLWQSIREIGYEVKSYTKSKESKDKK